MILVIAWCRKTRVMVRKKKWRRHWLLRGASLLKLATGIDYINEARSISVVRIARRLHHRPRFLLEIWPNPRSSIARAQKRVNNAYSRMSRLYLARRICFAYRRYFGRCWCVFATSTKIAGSDFRRKACASIQIHKLTSTCTCSC